MGKKNKEKYEVYAKKGNTHIQKQEVGDRNLGEWIDNKKSINENTYNQMFSCDGYVNQDFYYQKW